jgi:predicted permease
MNVRVYRWLLRLCPMPLRREYGAAMEDTFARRMADARKAGRLRHAGVWCREVAGLLALAVSERWGSPARVRRHRQRMLANRKAGVMDVIRQEITHAARRLAHTPVFTLAAAFTLALAIAANVAIFTLVYRVVINPLPFPQSSRVILLDFGMPTRNVPAGINSMTWQAYFQLADNARTIDGIAAYDTGSATLSGGATPERIVVSRATPSLLRVLRVSAALGRWFTESEGTPGAASVAVLSQGLWVSRFGGDPDVVGRTLSIDGVPTQVIGVMPSSFTFPSSQVGLWMPAQSTRAQASFLFSITGIARLRDNVTVAEARSEITQQIEALGRVAINQRALVSTALPLQDAVVGRIANALWILLGSVGLVLLVACANIANLFLVRSETRQREIAVRRALGARTAGIARYFLTESVLLAIVGGGIGLALAWGGVQLLVAFGPQSLPRLNEVRLDGVVVVFTIGLTLLAGVAFGAIPVLRLAPLTGSLHESGRGRTATRVQHRTRHLLMGAQVALAVMLLVASGLMIRSFQKLRAADIGFDPSSALTFSVALPDRAYATREAAVAAQSAILERISNIPGVRTASSSTCLPFNGVCFGNVIMVEGELPNPNWVRPWGRFRAVAGGYFEAMGMRLKRGRTISQTDVDRRAPVVVVDEVLADAYFPGQDPIGKRVRSLAPQSPRLPPTPWLEIVGVVARTPSFAIAEPVPQAQLFMPMSIAGGPEIPNEALIGPSPMTMSYVVRSTTAPSDLTAAIRAAVAEQDPNLAVAQVRTLEEIVARASDQTTFTMVLLAIAASVALLLGAIGIYGVVSYIGAQRTGEIGVRLALGAAPATVAALILRQSAIVTAIGILVGVIGALAGGRFIRSLLYNVSPSDPVVIAATTILLAAIALVACWLPARRASRLSPLDALRAE